MRLKHPHFTSSVSILDQGLNCTSITPCLIMPAVLSTMRHRFNAPIACSVSFGPNVGIGVLTSRTYITDQCVFIVYIYIYIYIYI